MMELETAVNVETKVVRIVVTDHDAGERMFIDMKADVVEALIDNLKEALRVVKTAKVFVPGGDECGND